MSEPTNDVEEMAAFLDGRLTGQRRVAFMARLAESTELRETLGEAAGLLRELEGAEQLPALDTRSWWSDHQRTFLIAAGILLVAIVPAVQVLTRRAPALSGNQAVLRVASSLPVGLDTLAWPEARTRGGASALAAGARAARAGALFTDLELQVMAADSAAAHTASRIIALVPDTPMSGLVIGVLRDLGTSLQLSFDERALRLGRARVGLARLLGEDRMTAAALIERARIAAFQRDSSFFRGSANALDRARTSPALTDGERNQLTRAVAAVPGEWSVALQHLTSLLVVMGS